MGLLAKINGGRPMPKDIRDRIEDFFEFYWNNDRLRAFKGSVDRKLLNELQDTFVQQILMEFLYVDFLYIFRFLFVSDAEALQSTF